MAKSFSLYKAMKLEVDQALEILAQTPSTVKSMLGNLSDRWLFLNEGTETWSPFDVIGHLIHGEKNDWIPRAEIILNQGENPAFEPFNRFAQFEESRGKSLQELLTTFELLRLRNIETLNSMNLTPEKMELTGLHPEFGRVTLEQLIATWAVHDLDHIAQIARVLAKQYSEAVGPWRAYLSVLNK